MVINTGNRQSHMEWKQAIKVIVYEKIFVENKATYRNLKG